MKLPVAAEGVSFGSVKTIRFTKKGHLAIFDQDHSFVVVDTRTKAARHIEGHAKEGSSLGFDNRCDVTLAGVNPNVDRPWVESDPAEHQLVVSRDESPSGTTVVDLDTGKALAVGPSVSMHANAIVDEGDDGPKSVVLYGTSAVSPLTLGGSLKVVDSSDAHRRTAFVSTTETGEFLLEDPSIGRVWKLPPEKPDGEQISIRETWVSFDRNMLVVVGDSSLAEEASAQRVVLVTFDLSTNKRTARTTFPLGAGSFKMLVASDGSKMAWSDRFVPPQPPDRELWNDDGRTHRCSIHVLDTKTGKEKSWRAPSCAITSEAPIRFEGTGLVTDAANIAGCDAPLYRTYDMRTGALKATRKGEPIQDDVDPDFLRVAKAKADGVMLHAVKPREWAPFYRLDEVVEWPEGTMVIARRGADIVACTKRGATCGQPLAPAGTERVSGSSVDGSRVGLVVDGHTYVFDVVTGQTLFEGRGDNRGR